jgi:hypothetical protein
MMVKMDSRMRGNDEAAIRGVVHIGARSRGRRDDARSWSRPDAMPRMLN